MKKILALAISIIGFSTMVHAQTLLYQWAFTNVSDTVSNSAASYAITPGTGNLILQNVSGNVFGNIGVDGVNPLLYFTNANNGPGSGPGVDANGELAANGQGYNGGNTGIGIATNLNLGTLYQFTVTFWVQLNFNDNAQFPRFVAFSAETNYDAGGKGVLVNGVGSSVNTAPAGYLCVQNGIGGSSSSQNPIMSVTNAFPNGLPLDGSWIFEAITYDGTVTTSNFVNWVGLTSQSVQIVTGGINTANYGGINFTTNATVLIGNIDIPTLPRALSQGGVADVRIYSGVVSSNNLDLIRTFQAPVLIPPNLTPASVVVQPASGNSFVGGTRSFSISASGNPSTFTYLWRSNGVPVAGSTGPTLTLSNLQLAANGASFICSVTNAIGGTNSNPAIVTVVPVATAGGYAQAAVANNPYSFWRINEMSNNVPILISDYVGGHDGVAVDPINMLFLGGPASPLFAGFPVNNTSIETRGAAGASRLNLTSPVNYNSGMTIAGWVNVPGIGAAGDGIIYNQASDLGPYFGLTFGTTGTGTGGGNGSEVDYIWGPAVSPAFSSGIDMNTNEWTFIALVISTNATPDTNATIYVGSESLGLLSANDDTATNGHTIGSVTGDRGVLALGRSTSSSSENGGFYQGTTSQYSDVAVFNSALSPSAITNLFLSGVGLHLQAVPDPSIMGNLLLTWPYGYLQSSVNVTGPYTDVPNTTNGVPYSIPTSGSRNFFRVSPTP
jgi:hypothetical protein